MPTYNEAIVAPAFTFASPKSVQKSRVWTCYGHGLRNEGGVSMDAQAPGTTVSGLEGAACDDWWIRGWPGYVSGSTPDVLNIGDKFSTRIDDLLVPGSKLFNVILAGEVTTGSATWLCKLQSQPTEGTSPVWTDLASGEAVMNASGRGQMVFAPVASGSGLPVYTHGQLHATPCRYRLFWEVTAKTGNPVDFGLYGSLDLVYTETDVWDLMGSAIG